jgi:hypothetical protein
MGSIKTLMSMKSAIVTELIQLKSSMNM